VGRAADVAPATVRNQFPEPADLANAVFDEGPDELRRPGQQIFRELRGIGARIERLAAKLAAIYERSQPWWQAFERDPAGRIEPATKPLTASRSS
jgi:AcrR family transcriptional regulator